MTIEEKRKMLDIFAAHYHTQMEQVRLLMRLLPHGDEFLQQTALGLFAAMRECEGTDRRPVNTQPVRKWLEKESNLKATVAFPSAAMCNEIAEMLRNELEEDLNEGTEP